MFGFGPVKLPRILRSGHQDFLARGKMVGTRLNSTLLTQRILIDFNIVTETCLAILASYSFFFWFLSLFWFIFIVSCCWTCFLQLRQSSKSNFSIKVMGVALMTSTVIFRLLVNCLLVKLHMCAIR